MKKVFLLLLLISTLTTQAQTYWDGTADKNLPGEGTEASPYLISTPEQLAGLAERTNVDKEDFSGKYIKLTADIYLTDLSQEGETRKQWTPIGDVFYGNYSIDPESGEIISPERQEALFCGHFDGDGHTIYNLYYVPVDDWGGENFDPYVDELTDVDFSSYNKALFGNIAGGSVKNLTLSNANIAGIGYIALLACNVKQGSTISNCHVQGKLLSLSASMGGIAGENGGLIEQCSANVELTQGRIGGLVHTNQETGVIRDCSVSGKAYSTSGDIGGFVHTNLGLIERCSASVDIQALYGKIQGNVGAAAYRGRWAGGFVFSNMYAIEDGRVSHQGIIRECYATGSLQSNNGGKLGGFGIWNYGLIESCYTTSQMSLADTDDGARTYMSLFLQENGSYFRDEALPGDCINCFAASTFVLPDADRYACAPFTEQFNHSWEDEATGFVHSREIGCYWNKDAFTTTGAGHSVAYLGTEKTLSYMKSQAFVDDLNRMAALCGTSTWAYRSGDFPQTTGVKAVNLTDYLGGGDGTQANPYLVNNKEQLANIGWYVDHGYNFKHQYLKQTADIALNLPMENWGQEMPTEWQPIGSTHHYQMDGVVDIDYPFSGNYDGNFHEVQNMYIDNNQKNQGLFGLIGAGCTFRNLGVTGAYVRAGGCGLIVGKGGEDNHFIQCWTSGDVEHQGTDYGYFGGIAGDLDKGALILNCTSSARVAGPQDYTSSFANTGGTLGETFINCIFTGDVPWAKNWTGYSASAMSGGQYNENVFCNDDIMHYDNTDEFSFDSKTTAWLQSKECANVLNDAVSRWNAAHDESLQLNCWQWQEGQYPHLSAAADYQPSVKITFVSNGGTDVISKVLEEGSSVTAPRRPTRDGYYFAGWYKDEALTKFFDWENTVLTESITLYAKWVEDHSDDVDVTPFNNKFTKEYHIKTAAQLRGLAQVVNGKWDWSNFDKEHPDFKNYEPTLLVAPRTLEGCTVILDNDLVLNDITDWQHWGHDGYAEPWRPIGVIDWLGSQSRTSFQGTFDGQGHTISGMYIEMSAVKVYDPQRYYWGLFSELGEKAVIKNLGIEASVINGKKYDDVEHYIGQRMDAVGLLAGYAFGSSFEQCYAVGRIIEDGLYQNMCKNIGGLIGIGDYWGDTSISLSDCYARVDMEASLSSASYMTGYGLIGSYEPHGTITNCYSGGQSYRGLSSQSSSMIVSSSYYDSEIITVNSGTGTARSTEEMKMKGTYKDWDFETTWGRNDSINDGYPYLRIFHPDAPADSEEPIMVTGITFEEDKTSTILVVGETKQLHAAVVPENAGNKNLIWTVTPAAFSDASALTIDENGLLTAHKSTNGHAATVTVTSEWGHYSGNCYVSVRDTIHPTSIYVHDISRSMNLGDTQQLSVTFYPDNSDNMNVVWTSSDETILTVSETGLVTAVGFGTANITATAEDQTNAYEGHAISYTTLNITIAPILVNRIEWQTEPKLEMTVGDTQQLAVILSPDNATDKTVSWTSSDTNVLTVSQDGLVTAVGEGRASITATAEGSDPNWKESVSTWWIEVKKLYIPVESIVINEGDQKLGVGESKQLTVTILPKNATDQGVGWESSSIRNVSVDNGLVTVLRYFTEPVTITASTSNGLSATITVTFDAKIDVVAEGYTGIYDGQPHGINVTATEGGIVMYGTTTETYDRDESPAYTNAGEYTVYYRVYYQVSKNRYEILEAGSEIVTITKAPLTVTADDSSMEEGSKLPPLTVSYEGWKNGENERVLTEKPVATTTATPQSPMGEYPITVSGGKALNYSFIYVDGTFTITMSDGIDGTSISDDVTGIARYDIHGRKIAKPQKGINIIRYPDGTIRKMMIK